jgi:hypothetical protein
MAIVDQYMKDSNLTEAQAIDRIRQEAAGGPYFNGIPCQVLEERIADYLAGRQPSGSNRQTPPTPPSPNVQTCQRSNIPTPPVPTLLPGLERYILPGDYRTWPPDPDRRGLTPADRPLPEPEDERFENSPFYQCPRPTTPATGG